MKKPVIWKKEKTNQNEKQRLAGFRGRKRVATISLSKENLYFWYTHKTRGDAKTLTEAKEKAESVC